MSDGSGRPTVVHVITRLIVGGAQLTALGVCEGIADRFETHLVSGTETGSEGSLHDRAQEAVSVRFVEPLRRGINPVTDVAAVRSLRRLFTQLDPDIVHTHSSKAGAIGRMAARGTRAKLVHTVHGWGHTPADSKVRQAVLVQVERSLARRTDALIAVSDDVRAEGERRGIGTPGQYVVIPELVDLAPHNPDFVEARSHGRRLLGLEAVEGPTIGWVGRFVPQKDPGMLSQVMIRVLTERSDANAVLIGDGPGRDEFEAALAAAGVAKRVRFAGLRTDARELYAAMDVVVHTSRWEGQPRVVQEALAERVPVVATRVSGVPQLIHEGLNGFVIEPGDVDAMASRVVSIVDARGPRAPLAGAALKPLTDVAGAERCLAGHHDLYERLLRWR